MLEKKNQPAIIESMKNDNTYRITSVHKQVLSTKTVPGEPSVIKIGVRVYFTGSLRACKLHVSCGALLKQQEILDMTYKSRSHMISQVYA